MLRLTMLPIALILLLSPAGQLSLARAQSRGPDPRFGIVESFVNPDAATEAGAGYTRIILRWDIIQPAGPLDWKPANVPDPLVAQELAAGREIVAVLIGTPAWASTQGGHSAQDVPDMFYWEAFVRRMVQQYRGRIHHWVIWNEPDVWDLTHPGNTWAGSVEDYYHLLRTAYTAIKAEDSSQQVAIAGLTYYWDWEHGRRRYLDRLLDVIAADPDAVAHSYYFDAIVYHLYFNPSQTVDVLEEAKRSLGSRGVAGKELWVNETNAPPSADPQEPPSSPPRFQVSLREQASFIIQEYALAFAAGASRVEVYKLRNTKDHPESIEPYGLLRADDSPRPAFAAYRVVTTYLGGFRTAYRETMFDVNAVTFDRGIDTTTVLWVNGRQTKRVRVAAIARAALLLDSGGASRQITPVAGFYTLELPGATCLTASPCMIGGAPSLLVEAGVPAGRRALVGPATFSSTPTPKPAQRRPPLCRACQ